MDKKPRWEHGGQNNKYSALRVKTTSEDTSLRLVPKRAEDQRDTRLDLSALCIRRGLKSKRFNDNSTLRVFLSVCLKNTAVCPTRSEKRHF